MKNLLGILLLAVLSFSSFAQKETSAIVKGNASSMKVAVEAGVFEFQFPTTCTNEMIEKNKTYYTKYFSVDYLPSTHIATIKMVDNTPEARRVIIRFLVSNKLRTVQIDGNSFTVSEFYEKYLK